MKKSLIALAVAGVFVAPAAMADVVIYGQANASFDVVNNDKVGTSTNKVSSNASRLGAKGSEDIGSGNSVIWQFEAAVNIDAGAANEGNFGSRDTFVGLSGESWGNVILGGGLNSVGKQAIKPNDLFDDTRGDNGGNGASMLFYPRVNNQIVYSSPDLSGFKIKASYGAASETASVSGGTKGSDYALSGAYDSGPLYAALAYENRKGGSTAFTSSTPTTLAANETVSITSAAVAYTFDAFWAGLTVQRVNDSPAVGASQTRTAYVLGGKYSFGSDAVKLQYTQVGQTTGTPNSGGKHFAIGYDHGLSKNTYVYALYARVNNDSGASFDVNGGNGVQVAGASPSAFSLGIHHNF